ncbi:unnamed protein product [Arabidopsis halleri]
MRISDLWHKWRLPWHQFACNCWYRLFVWRLGSPWVDFFIFGVSPLSCGRTIVSVSSSVAASLWLLVRFPLSLLWWFDVGVFLFVYQFWRCSLAQAEFS